MKRPTLSSDRRVSPRFIADFPVKVEVRKLHCKPSMVSGRTANISKQGLSLILDAPLPLSSLVALSLDLAPSYPSVQTKGRVIWSNPLPGGEEFLCGVQILGLKAKHLLIVGQLIKDKDKEKFEEKVFDRRERERRKEMVPIDFLERRIRERRSKTSVFKKCVTVLRSNLLRDQEVFAREILPIGHSKVMLARKELITFSCCSYLGLAVRPEVKEAIIEGVKKYGTHISSSRVLGGTSTMHNLLEKEVAKFIGGENCITYNGGYLANLGCIPALVTKNDFVIIDAKSHASVIDACRLTGGNLLTYTHSNMGDLEEKLKKCRVRSNKLIVTDGVFSMDGDLAKLDKIFELSQKYNAGLMVDDAHAIGVLGENGAGTCEYFGLKGKIDLVMGTFSKAFGGFGGFVVGRKKVIDYLRYASRTFVFSLGLPIPIVAGLLAALDIIKKEPQLRVNLWRNVRYLKENLQGLGYDTGNSQAAIIPVIIGDDIKTCQMARRLEHLGIFADAIVYPAVRKRESRLRLIVTSVHSVDELEKTIWVFKKTGKELNLI